MVYKCGYVLYTNVDMVYTNVEMVYTNVDLHKCRCDVIVCPMGHRATQNSNSKWPPRKKILYKSFSKWKSSKSYLAPLKSWCRNLLSTLLTYINRQRQVSTQVSYKPCTQTIHTIGCFVTTYNITMKTHVEVLSINFSP